MNEEIADLQAQIVALRIAVESAWLSLLQPAADPVGDARQLGEQHVAAVQAMTTSGPVAQGVQQRIIGHTQQIWGSIAWQLENPPKQA